jgi:hypothetical protein
MREFALLLSCAILISTASADTVQLKDGSRIEGEILTENGADIIVESEYACGTISTTRRIKKSDVAEIKRLSPEEKRSQAMESAYRATQTYNLDANNSLPLAAYDWVIRCLHEFLSKHPNSPYATEVAAKLDAWEAERHQVFSGNRKVHGHWMSELAVVKPAPLEPKKESPVPPAPPPPPALLAQVGDILKQYWVFALIGVVGVLWLVTRLFTKD